MGVRVTGQCRVGDHRYYPGYVYGAHPCPCPCHTPIDPDTPDEEETDACG